MGSPGRSRQLPRRCGTSADSDGEAGGFRPRGFEPIRSHSSLISDATLVAAWLSSAEVTVLTAFHLAAETLDRRPYSTLARSPRRAGIPSVVTCPLCAGRHEFQGPPVRLPPVVSPPPVAARAPPS